MLFSGSLIICAGIAVLITSPDHSHTDNRFLAR